MAAADALIDAARDTTDADGAHWLLNRSRIAHLTPLNTDPAGGEDLYTRCQLDAHVQESVRTALAQAASLTRDTNLAGWLLTRTR